MKMLVDRWYWTPREMDRDPGPSPIFFRNVPEPYRSTLPDQFAEAARRAGGIIERTYCLHGDVLRLRFAGPALVPILTPALAHRAVTEDQPVTFTIHLWDSASTGLPPPLWPAVKAAPPAPDRPVFPPLDAAAAQVLSALDDQRNGYFWVRDADLPLYERSGPCAQLLCWWWRAQGRQLLHAAAVGGAAGAALLPARSGSGKSTTALACLHAGLGYLGDDLVLAATEPGPMLMNVYNTAKVHAANLERVSFASPLVRNEDRLAVEKAVMFLHDSHAAQLIDRAPLRAILLPRITGLLETRLQPASPTAAMTALIPSLFMRSIGERNEGFATFAALVRQAPCYWLELGTDLAGVARVIADTLGIASDTESARTTSEDVP